MNKKVLLLIIVLVLSPILVVNSIPLNSQDFEGLFTMEIPVGKEYGDVACCYPNGRLGSAKEFWDVSSDCELDSDEIVIFYYNDSYLVEGEKNAWDHALKTLNISYFYQFYQKDGDLLVLTNDIGMRNLPPYIVGVTNDDKSKVVFVGGYHLDDLKHYASTVEFK